MMEDKIKATDWEATNEAIEEQVQSFKSFHFSKNLSDFIPLPGCSGVLLAVVGGAGEAEEKFKEPSSGNGD